MGTVTHKHVKAARLRLGESQTVFGQRFGVDQTTVHRWETNGIPERGTTRKAIEHVLNALKAEEVAP